MPTQTKADLGRELVRTLRELRTTPATDQGRTDLLREAARLSVDLREHFLTPAGTPDWAARTWTYRNFLRDRYTEAGYSLDDARKEQATVRYHVSHFVRQKLTPEQLTDLGLRTETAADRSREQRGTRRALLDAALAPSPGETDADAVRSLAGALLVLERLSTKKLSELTGAELAQARAVMARLEQRVVELAYAAASAGE